MEGRGQAEADGKWGGPGRGLDCNGLMGEFSNFISSKAKGIWNNSLEKKWPSST